jgi:outer membrane protein assembly factor BamD (BamD/ComL family)
MRFAVALLLGVATAHAQSGQAEFDAATALEAKGEYALAADALEKLARERPDDPFADDALFEAATIAEERLADPERAQRLYDAVATRYPSSRLERRARTRADFLASSLKSGAGPLKEYQAITAPGKRPAPPDLIARMEALLQAHPDFALTDRALYWLGEQYAASKRTAEAEARFIAVEQRFPGGEWASRAKKSRADILLSRGHPFAARALYRELRAQKDLVARVGGEEGLMAVDTAIRRFVELLLAIAYLLAFALLHALAIRRHSGRGVPTEVLFYAPVALLFVIAAATENPSILWATLAIAGGGGAIVWLSCAVRADGEPWSRRLLRLASSSVAVLALMFVAIQTTGLTDLVLETLRMGPER